MKEILFFLVFIYILYGFGFGLAHLSENSRLGENSRGIRGCLSFLALAAAWPFWKGASDVSILMGIRILAEAEQEDRKLARKMKE